MKRVVRILLWTSLFLFLSSMATCYFGVKYAVTQIPPEVRGRMHDTDWVGVEWITCGSALLLLSLATSLAALCFWAVRKKRGNNNQNDLREHS
jgi:hypothetical protein